MAGRQLYRHTDAALVRAAWHVDLALPAWPDLTRSTPADAERWCRWLRDVWSVEAVADAIEHASPVLAREVDAVSAGARPAGRQARRMVLSVARYLLRMTGRATPFGLFAGVATASFSQRAATRWGSDHRPIGRAGATWLADVVGQLEACPQLLERLPVAANNLCFTRGGRLVVPYQSETGHPAQRGPVEVSIRWTPAVRTAVESARSPILCSQLTAILSAAFPTAPPARIGQLLTDLVARRVLITSLHAPSTVTDAFAHVLTELETARADDVPEVVDLLARLAKIATGMERHNRATTMARRRAVRRQLVNQMTAVSSATARPVALDLRLDCDVVLPQQVAEEAEAAASALCRLTPHPFGSPAWQSYHNRFFERYGVGALVPLLDVVDSDIGLGFPAGFAGSMAAEPPRALSARDERLLALAQTAALDAQDEILLDDRLINELAAGDVEPTLVPAHTELCFELRSPSTTALEQGRFDLAVLGASRGAGTMVGRFVGLLEPCQGRSMARALAEIPTGDPDAIAVQLSFPPLLPGTADVARSPELLPRVISLGEHRAPEGATINLADLAVGCDSNRLYLISRTLGRRLEPAVLHALDLRAHTPPLARFLAEVARAQQAALTGFDWGAARSLPLLPRVRYRRTILSPARWLVNSAELPRHDAVWPEWEAAIKAWCRRRRLPEFVHLAEGDRRLRLHLTQPGHLALLRAHLDSSASATLTEAADPRAYGWFGGRSHEIALPLTAVPSARRPSPPPVLPAPVIRRDHGHLPAASRWLYAKLYGHPQRQAEILVDHLPDLLSTWDAPPLWWFIRYRDPEWHLRLRISLPDEAAFGPTARRVSVWVHHLRCRGLLRDVQFAEYRPEIGRWGGGHTMAAAEEVFAADSRALVAQFAASSPPPAQALCAANFVAITTGFMGDVETGMRWLIEHARPERPSDRPRPGVADTAVRLADPGDDWSELRRTPGGQLIAAAWAVRHRALADYRVRLAAGAPCDPNALLVSLLHAHHIRAVGIDRDDERTCLHLARSAALAWTARSRA